MNFTSAFIILNLSFPRPMLPVTDPQTLLLALLYLGLIFLLGYAVVSAVLKPGTRRWVELGALCYACGSGVLSLILFDLSIAGLKPSRPILTGIAIVALIAIIVLWSKRRILAFSVPSPRHRLDALGLLGLLSAALIVATMGNIAARAAWPGLTDIDAFAIWMLKAKWVLLDALRPIPAVFRDPILSYSHQDYPLSLPLLVAGFYSVIGRMDDTAAKLLLIPSWLALAATIYGAVRRYHRRAIALAVTAVFCTAPTLTLNAALLVAETPLLLALAAAAAQLLHWIEGGETGDLILAGLLAAIAAFTKNEGLALLPVLGLSALFVALRQGRLKDFARSALICLIAISPWLIYRTQLPHTHEDYGGKLLEPAVLLHNLPQRADVLGGFIGRLFDAPRAGLIWYVLIISALLSPRALLRTSTLVLWCVLLVQLLLYLATFIVTPWDVAQLLPMIAPKLLTQPSPIAALLIALNLREMRWPRSEWAPGEHRPSAK